jgi:protein gp37
MNESQTMKLEVTSWNPFTGCTKISPACKHCYAEGLALKLNKWGTAGYENTFQFTVHQDRLEKVGPVKRKKPTLYFINSMSDTFHEDADEQSIDAIMNIVKQAHWHNFYTLTKRSNRMREYFQDRTVPENLWLGVTVEDKKYGLPRLKNLQKVKAINKHICCEPLLEDLGIIDLAGISLVVAGGESGPNARRADLRWVESLRHQCEAQNAHFYWKSWGSYNQDGVFKGNGNSGCLINGKEHLSFPSHMMPRKK